MKSNKLFIVLAIIFIAFAFDLKVLERRHLFKVTSAGAYLFDSATFVNADNYLEQNSVMPLCDLKEKWGRSCESLFSRFWYMKASDLTRASELSKDSTWRLHIIDVRESEISLNFIAPEGINPAGRLHPSAWIDSHSPAENLVVFIDPVLLDVQLSNDDVKGYLREPIEFIQAGESLARVTIPLASSRGFSLKWETPTKLKIRLRSSEPKPAHVFLDAGHGGTDRGACVEGICESKLSLEIARELADLLSSRGLHVSFSRNRDDYLTLEERVGKAERANPDLFVSIHLDSWHEATSIPPPTGLSCYFQQRISAPYCRKLLVDLRSQQQATSFISRRSLFVLQSQQFPSILLEMANLKDDQDRMLILDTSHRTQMLGKIADSILEIFGESQ